MIADLDKIEFHDLPINSLLLDFNKREVLLIVNDCDNDTNEYFEIKLHFLEVSDFYIDKIEDLYIDEITNCNIEKQGDLFFIKYEMLYKSCKNLFMSFKFKDVEVIVQPGFSPKKGSYH